MNSSGESKIEHVRAKTLTLHWHEGAAAIYSVGTQPGKAGERSARLVTGGGDNNVRVWKVDYNDEGSDVVGVEYLSSITKHTQAVNCVRFNRTGDLLATASDDGTIMIWEMNDSVVQEFGQDPDDDIKESWVLKIACFASSMSEIYDICWSPDSKYICCGLMDNIIRIFSVATGSMVKQIAEHSHYVQGVAWDPQGDYICSQSADRSVHVYKVSTNEAGELVVGPTAFYKSVKSEVPALKFSQLTSENLSKNSAATSSQEKSSSNVLSDATTASNTRASTPVSSMTSASNSVVHTPIINSVNVIPNATLNAGTVMARQSSGNSTMMEPPLQAPRHKRTYSNSSAGSSHSVANRCLSPLPLPAVMPSSPSHLHLGLSSAMSPTSSSTFSTAASTSNVSNENNTNTGCSDNMSTGRDIFSVPSSTPSAIPYKQHYLYHNETLQSFFRRLTFSPDGSILITTCGIYKPNSESGKEEIQNTVYVYTRAGLNRGPVVHLPGLRKPAIVIRFSPVRYSLFEKSSTDKSHHMAVNVFNLPYRMLFAIATQDSILIYDTQRLKCVAVVTSIHYAVITDVAWSSDGRTVFVSSNDGFISCVVLGKNIVGEVVGGFDLEELQEITKHEKASAAATPISRGATPGTGESVLPPVIKRADKLDVTATSSVKREREHDSAKDEGKAADVVELLKGGEGDREEGAKRVCL